MNLDNQLLSVQKQLLAEQKKTNDLIKELLIEIAGVYNSMEALRSDLRDSDAETL